MEGDAVFGATYVYPFVRAFDDIKGQYALAKILTEGCAKVCRAQWRRITTLIPFPFHSPFGHFHLTSF
jgi:hypothetical protein